MAIAATVALAGGVLLRFWTRSDLWLDEAQTLAIARLPLSHIFGALRQDGSPPLYYFMLHFWAHLFGTSTFAVRALPGLIGTATLPLAWLSGRKLAGRSVAWATVILVATSPFAIWYSTDLRMYSLLVLEVFAGGLLLASCIRRPGKWNLVALAADASALVYTHYWSFFLIAAILAGLGIQAALRPPKRRSSLASLVAIVAGCLTFLPWLGSFLFQLHHTGTPWSAPAGLSIYRDTMRQFSGGLTDEGLLLECILLLLLVLGVFATAIDRYRIRLDLRARHSTRWIAGLAIATLALAIAGGKIAGTGFQDRYASVVFPEMALVAACGTTAFASTSIRRAILAAAAALGLFGASYNVTTQRTQAVQLTSFLHSHAQPGDVVGYCPDQLGPDTSRLLPGDLRQIAFPRGNSPSRVDWVDYLSAIDKAKPSAFAEKLVHLAGPAHAVWLVWQGGYRGFGHDCETIAKDLATLRPIETTAVQPHHMTYSEASHLSEFLP